MAESSEFLFGAVACSDRSSRNAALLARPVTGEAGVGEQGPDVAVEPHRFGGRTGPRHEKSAKESEGESHRHDWP